MIIQLISNYAGSLVRGFTIVISALVKLDRRTTNKFKASLWLHPEFQASLGLQSEMGGVEEDEEEQQDVEDEEKTVYL